MVVLMEFIFALAIYCIAFPHEKKAPRQFDARGAFLLCGLYYLTMAFT